MKRLSKRLSPIKSYKRAERQEGFTLIELMIVIAIIGIISAVAFPSYSSYMTKSRRADAKITLTKMADAQERWYLQNSTYTTTVADVGGATSPDGNYKMEISSADLNGYVMKATAIAAQAGDADCTSFILASTGAKTSTPGIKPCW